jgi:hypothetical protein
MTHRFPNRRKRFAAATVAIAALLLLAGCGKSEIYGKSPEAETVPAGKILADPGSFGERPVSITGEILAVCPAGCWFQLRDESGGVLLVDLKPSGLAIPQVVGRKATAQGTVAVRGGRILLHGDGVRIQ